MTRLGAIDFFGLEPLPGDPIERAANLSDLGVVRRAMATINYALIRDPALEPAWRTKYAFLSGLGFHAAALAVIEAAMEHVVNPDLLISYGHLLQSLDRPAEAIDVYREYLATVPEGEYAGIALCNMANARAPWGMIRPPRGFICGRSRGNRGGRRIMPIT